MPMEAEDLAEMESLIQVARKREVNYAICMGKNPEGTIFMLHRKKKAEILARLAKREGETAKLAYGTCQVKGKKIFLRAMEDPPPAMARQMKVFLKDNGIPFKVTILDANGNEIDNDGDEGDNDDLDVLAGDGGQSGPSPDLDDIAQEELADPLQARWLALLGPLGKAYDAAMAQNPPSAAKLEAAWTMAREKAEAGDYKSALAVAKKLAPALATVTGTPNVEDAAPSPEAAKWSRIAAAIDPLYAAAMKTNPANATKLSAAWAMATEKAAAGDYTAAMTIVAKLKPALDAAAKGGGGDAPSGKTNIVAFQKSRVLWASTRKKMHSEMQKLETAIANAVKEDPDLADIAGKVGALSTRLNVFDEDLEDILDKVTNAEDEAERAKLKETALAKIKAYQTALDEDFFKAVDSDNGFANVSVASAANASLASIAKAIAS
ncbi:MAG: hypothetical protein AAF646_03885 [Pseudomonadota bacterium]